MRLSMSMLESYLSDYLTESHIEDDDPTIRGVRFLTDQQLHSSRDYVFLGSAESFFQDMEHSGLLILTNAQSHILCHAGDYDELLNEVLSAFEYFNDVEQRLAMAAAEHLPLAEMLTSIDKALPYPFLVFSIDGTYLGGTHVELVDNDLISQAVDVGKLEAGTIGQALFDESGAMLTDLASYPKAMRLEPDGPVRAVDMYLSNMQENIGFVICFIPEGRPVELAIHLEGALAHYLAQSAEFTAESSPHLATHTALVGLLDGKEVSPEAVRRIKKIVGERSTGHIIAMGSRTIQNATLRSVMTSEAAALESCVACTYGDHVVVLAPADGLDGVLSAISGSMRPADISVGVSLPIHSHLQVPTAFRQALFALESRDEAGIRQCRDLAMPYLMHSLRRTPSAQDLAHPALAALRDYDERSGSELQHTLIVYVSSGLRQTESAKRMHVHLNTLKYRIKKIEEIAGIDFNDDDEVFYLRLSIAMSEEA